MLKKQEKMIIDKQNEIIKNFIFDKYSDTTFDISRDNKNRVVALFGSIDKPMIIAKVLGLNKVNRPIVKQVGNLIYSFENDASLSIDNVFVDECYAGSDIEQIMIQGIQNFASELGIRTIKTVVHASDQMLDAFSKNPVINDEVVIDPLLLTFFSNNYSRFFPYGKSFVNYNPLKDPKYYLENKSIKHTNIGYGTSAQTPPQKINKHFKPYKVLMENESRQEYIADKLAFNPMKIYPTEGDLQRLQETLVQRPQEKILK